MVLIKGQLPSSTYHWIRVSANKESPATNSRNYKNYGRFTTWNHSNQMNGLNWRSNSKGWYGGILMAQLKLSPSSCSRSVVNNRCALGQSKGQLLIRRMKQRETEREYLEMFLTFPCYDVSVLILLKLVSFHSHNNCVSFKVNSIPQPSENSLRGHSCVPVSIKKRPVQAWIRFIELLDDKSILWAQIKVSCELLIAKELRGGGSWWLMTSQRNSCWL